MTILRDSQFSKTLTASTFTTTAPRTMSFQTPSPSRNIFRPIFSHHRATTTTSILNFSEITKKTTLKTLTIYSLKHSSKCRTRRPSTPTGILLSLQPKGKPLSTLSTHQRRPNSHGPVIGARLRFTRIKFATKTWLSQQAHCNLKASWISLLSPNF